MDEVSYLEILPVEILHKISSYKSLSYVDISRLNCTSSYLRSVTNDNNLWKTKFFQTWERLGSGDVYEGVKGVNWREEAMVRLEVGREVVARLDAMAVSCRGLAELSHRQFRPFFQMANLHPRALHFVIDQLMPLVNDPDKGCNLSRKYYGLKVLRQMQQARLRSIWESIVARPENQQILEEGAFFLGQWQYPHMDVIYSHIRKALDELADEVVEVIYEMTGGRHPVLSVGARDPSWREAILDANKWSPEHCKQIITATSNLLFARKGFRVRRCIFQNLPINKELKVKECDPLTISIIYEGILRRLGVKCDLVSTSCHFLLSWSENPQNGERSDDDSNFIIDMKNEGVIIKKLGCPFLSNRKFKFTSMQVSHIGTSVRMVQSMGNKMFVTCMQNEAHTFEHVSQLRSTLEMVLVTCPDHFNNYIHLMDFYDINGIEIDPDVLDKLLNLLPTMNDEQRQSVMCFVNTLRRKNKAQDELNSEIDPSIVKRRSREVKFAIGLVMEHKQYGYKCVVYGWDQDCAASPDWMQTMRVHRLKYRHQQPFYNVLVDDGSLRYAAQENLRLVETDCEIEIPEVGRYFVKWCGRFYEPTPIKAAEYPEDAKARSAILDSAGKIILNHLTEHMKISVLYNF